MPNTKEQALEKIHQNCARAANGQCVDIPLTIFHEAYGPATPALEEVIAELKRRYGFTSHELNRDRGWLRLIKDTYKKGADQ